MPLGAEDHRIPNGHLSASSYYSSYYPSYGRLNSYKGWMARRRDHRQYLQFKLDLVTKITGVATQGRQNAHQWVKSYFLSYSRDGNRFVKYMEGKKLKVCVENVMILD